MTEMMIKHSQPSMHILQKLVRRISCSSHVLAIVKTSMSIQEHADDIGWQITSGEQLRFPRQQYLPVLLHRDAAILRVEQPIFRFNSNPVKVSYCVYLPALPILVAAYLPHWSLCLFVIELMKACMHADPCTIIAW